MFSPLLARTVSFPPSFPFRSTPFCCVTCFHSLLILSILLMKCKAHIDFLITRGRDRHFKDILTGAILGRYISRRLKKKRWGSQYQRGLISWQPYRELRLEQCASDLFIYLFLSRAIRVPPAVGAITCELPSDTR